MTSLSNLYFILTAHLIWDQRQSAVATVLDSTQLETDHVECG